MTEEEGQVVMPERSVAADLDAVSYGTHKESLVCIRDLAKTAGVLCSCLTSGVVVLIREIYG
eukprot:10790697-Karenia_brevis.AAC.1